MIQWSMLKKLLAVKAAQGVQSQLVEETATGNPASFVTDVQKALTGFTVPFTPVQAGTGDPSPDNIRPITGFAGVTATHCGKNLFDASSVIRKDGYYLESGGVETTSTVSGYTLSKTLVAPSTKYTFTGTIVGSKNGFRLYFYTGSGVYIERTQQLYIGDIPFTFTTPAKCHYIAFQYNIANVDFSTFQVEQGETATEFSAYSSNVYPVTFGEEPGTVYGGSVDLATGALAVGWANIASYNGETLPGEWLSDRDVYAEGTTPTTGAQVVYELATPVNYQIPRTKVVTLIGTNTIWADTNGQNTIKYQKET